VSSNATLTVNTSPVAPAFTQTIPATLYAYPGQTVTLAVSAFANPPPTYQWQSNSINLDGQTDTRLQIPISDTNQSATYTIIATNSAVHECLDGFDRHPQARFAHHRSHVQRIHKQ